jgi:tetratricopeptide (TPR) repeat protein
MRWLLVCLLSTTIGWAQDPSAQADDPDTQASQRHLERGRALSDEGRYDDAIAEFDLALKLKPLPELLFNIARTEERRENWAAAADAYEKYLQELPGAPDAAELQKRIGVLRARNATTRTTAVPMATKPTTTTPVPAPTIPAPAPKKSPLHTAALSFLAGTVILGGIAGVLVGTVDGGFQDLQQTCTLKQCRPSDWASLQARANAGYALVGIAGAAALTDVVLWMIDYRRGKATTQAKWLPSGLGVRGAF